MLGMTFNRKGIAFGMAYNSGTLLLGVASIIARLSAGVFVIVVRKAIFEGGPKTMEMGLWLRDQTIFFCEKSYKSINPRVIEVEKVLKALIIIAVRNLRTKGGPKIIATGQIISRECRLLIKTTVKRKKKLGSDKKHQVSLEEQVEDNISPSVVSADQTIQTYGRPDIFRHDHEDQQ
jgi:hypothetical protein